MLPRCQRSGISRNAPWEADGSQKATARVSSSRCTRSRSDSRMVQFTSNSLRLLCVQPSISYSNVTDEMRKPCPLPIASNPARRKTIEPGSTCALTCGQNNIALRAARIRNNTAETVSDAANPTHRPTVSMLKSPSLSAKCYTRTGFNFFQSIVPIPSSAAMAIWPISAAFIPNSSAPYASIATGSVPKMSWL